jgi:uncharacterized protein YbjT (DUF2867 family)
MKTVTVVGASSDIGRVVSKELTASGHEVRKVSRKHGISLDDEKMLTKAFSGADSAYLMIPFDMSAADLHERERQISARLVSALQGSGVRRIVLLSGLNAHLKIGSGMGAAIMEEALQEYEVAEMVFLRCGFFMENFLKGLSFPAQAASGSFQTAFRGDLPMPMIASADIANIVSSILIQDEFTQPRVRELHGARSYTFSEVTKILGDHLGYPAVIYEQCSYDTALYNMLSAGVSPSFANAVVETAESFNREDQWALEEPGSFNTTPTTLERFIQMTGV